LAAASGTPAQLGEVKLFDPRDGTLIRHLGSQADCALDLAFSPDGKRLAVCGTDHKVRVFAVADGTQKLQIDDHADWVTGVAFSPDGGKLASASRDKTCKVFDTTSGDLLVTYSDHNAAVNDVVFNADGRQVISCGGDNRIRVWHAADQGYEDKDKKKKKRQHIHDLGSFGSEIFQLTFHEGHVFSCASDAAARQHDPVRRSQIRQYSGHQEWVLAIAYNPATKRLATGSLDGEIRIWNTKAPDANQLRVATFIAAPGYHPVAATKPAEGTN
jgi:WD40 repeat protein